MFTQGRVWLMKCVSAWHILLSFVMGYSCKFTDLKMSVCTLIAKANTACLELVADPPLHMQSAADMALQSGMATKPEQ